MQKTDIAHADFSAAFADPPAISRGLDIVHQFRHRRSYRDIWHHLPADATRTTRAMQDQPVDPIFYQFYGPHEELDPDRGYRLDLRCILGIIPQLSSNADLDDLVRGGIGGLAGNVAWTAEYPYDEQDWDDFREVLAYCREHKLEVWWYDEAGYPSGHANQRTLAGHPEFLAQGIRWTQQLCQGPVDAQLALPEGELFAVVAVAEAEGQLDGSRQLLLPVQGNVTLPEGCWRVFAFATGPVWEGTHADYLNIRYPNLLDGAAVKRFLDLTHEEYFRQVGDWFGKTITGVFTDEPSLMAPIMPAVADGEWHLHLPWVRDLPEVFNERSGQSLAEVLPALIADLGAYTEQRRGAFWATIAHLLSTRCHRQIGEWCDQHGIAYTGHLLWEENLCHHVILHGDIMACLRWFGWPGYDALTSPVRDENPDEFKSRILGAKYASSVAHLYGKPHTMCETFGITAARPLRIYQHVLDVLVLLGLERHGYYSIWDKLTTDERRQLNTHLGRVVLAGCYGRHRCEIAILYPIVAAWAAYDASRPVHDQPIVSTLNDTLANLAQDLLDRQLDFDICDDDSLQQGHADAGRWRMGEESYRILLVPAMACMRLATLDTLARARQAGVVILFSDQFPVSTIENGADANLETWYRDIFPSPIPHATIPDAVLAASGEHLTLQPESRALWITHRQAKSADDEWSDIYLIVNTNDCPYDGHVAIPNNAAPYWCDIDSGQVSAAEKLPDMHRGETTVSLHIAGYGVKVLANRSLYTCVQQVKS